MIDTNNNNNNTSNNNNNHKNCNKKDWSCCFGQMHVQKAVFVIAFSYVILLVTMLCALMVTWLRERKPRFDERALLELSFLTEFHDENLQNQLNELFRLNEDMMLPKKVYILCFMTISVVIFVGILIYGLIKKVPCCVLPFYSWQIIDLVISVICIGLYIHYVRLINNSSASDNLNPNFKLFDISSFKFFCFTILTFASIVVLKIYAIIVVWRCFRYLAECAKCEVENERCLAGNAHVYKPLKLNQDMKKNAKDDDNHSMLNDSDTTIFINEDIVAKQYAIK